MLEGIVRQQRDRTRYLFGICGGQMKKTIAIVLTIVVMIVFVACGAKSIGIVSGAEYEFITIDGVKYVLDNNNHFSFADRGNYLGNVSNPRITMRVYSVKGDAEGNYIYVLWEWEGSFYKRQG